MFLMSVKQIGYRLKWARGRLRREIRLGTNCESYRMALGRCLHLWNKSTGLILRKARIPVEANYRGVALEILLMA